MLAALVPLGQVGSRTLDSQIRGAEALVLAFLAGALVRGWTLREFRSFPSTRLETAALIFGLVVAASSAEQLWFLQIQRDYPWPFVQDVMTYVSRDYVVTFRSYSMIFHAMLLLEGVALLVFTLKYASLSPEFRRLLVVMLICGAVGTVLLTFQDVATELAQTGEMRARLLELVAHRRWSAHVADVNAAASFFAMGMFIALGLAVKERRLLPAWVAAGAGLAIAMAMTQSRTAIVVVILVAACLLASSTIGRIIGVGKAIAVTAVASVVLTVGFWSFLPREFISEGASTSVEIRWLFLGTTWRMLMANPLFGVGIGQYPLWSFHFAAPELLKYYQRENAHNNFAQIAGELGVVGLLGFVALIAFALQWQRDPSTSRDRVTVPVIVGLAAFILSWLGGHPLLVPEVAYPFWLALGVVTAASLTTSSARYASALVAVALACLALSIPLRVHAKSRGVDFSRVSYGLSAKHMMTSHARFFVPAGTRRVDVPLRAHASNDEQPLVVDVLVDDVAGHSLAITEGEWRTAKVVLPEDSSRRFRQIDLRIRPAETREDGERDRFSVEVGNWAIITKPNG